MDARQVRAFLDALDAEAAPDPARVRWCLASLQRPDVRYLVATFLGAGGARVASVVAAVLEAAGAPTATLARGEARLRGSAVDDALLASAGTLVAEAALALDAQGEPAGQLTRREGEVLVSLVACAQASMRVALLVDEGVDAREPLHAVVPDLVVLCSLDDAVLVRALALVPDARPVVAAPPAADVRDRLTSAATARGLPLLLGGREFRAEEGPSGTEVFVGDARYAAIPRARGLSGDELATGVAAALGIGVLGVRMREEWVREGAAAAARATMLA